MSIVRVSALKGAIHGVKEDGTFCHKDYNRDKRLGKTETFLAPEAPAEGTPPVQPGQKLTAKELDSRGFPRPGSDLYHLLSGHLKPALKDIGAQPVVVMVHGFLFDPRDAVSPEPKDSDNPHARLYHFKQRSVAHEVKHHTTGWPQGLRFSEADKTGKDGMILAYGWNSKPGFAESLMKFGQNFYARAYSNAEGAAWNLLTALHVLDHHLPAGKKFDFFCHSLGSRVVIRTIALAAKHGRLDLIDRMDRVFILGGAEYVFEARLMLRRLAEVGMDDHLTFYNVVSRENDVLDKLGENFGPRFFGNSNVIGHNGLDIEDTKQLGNRWVDMQIDGAEFRAWIKQHREHDVTGDNPNSVWDHWYYFTDPGNMALYRDILRHDREADPDRWNITALRAAGMPDRVKRPRSLTGD